eukprot:TRINITY_DN1255_c0_g3_i1.p1 TRINITY_DN1255_c0_g3~~TRINITY_DN1255_c0_g3_i1.p1  ORF type:complete len:1791 (-),score=341.55 TRINITY_DN1255_c0_g3_i1:71-5443(-)
MSRTYEMNSESESEDDGPPPVRPPVRTVKGIYQMSNDIESEEEDTPVTTKPANYSTSSSKSAGDEENSQDGSCGTSSKGKGLEVKPPLGILRREPYQAADEESEEEEFRPQVSKTTPKTALYANLEEDSEEMIVSAGPCRSSPSLTMSPPKKTNAYEENEESEEEEPRLTKSQSSTTKTKVKRVESERPKKTRTPKKDEEEKRTTRVSVRTLKKPAAYEAGDSEEEEEPPVKASTSTRALKDKCRRKSEKSRKLNTTPRIKKTPNSSVSGSPTVPSASPTPMPYISPVRAESVDFLGNAKKNSSRDPDDWNERFQQILHMPESLQKNTLLSQLYADFVYAAKTYGRIIISEKFLPNDKKEIKPFDAGGRAGGVKYRCRGILFKFAIDTLNMGSDEEEDEFAEEFWMYGQSERADHLAAKAAGHELKGLINMFNYREKASNLHFPLLALIDYRGFRLIAISWLPLARLIYGSKDAARTVHADDPTLNKAMERIGRALNLAPHHVGDQPEMLYLCGDIEGHIGQDGKYYCLDFARVFPPEYLPEDEKQSVIECLLPCTPQKPTSEFLYKLLRPELVKGNEEPLNSDSLSMFIGSSYKEKNKARAGVINATKRMITDVIDSFAQEMISNIAPSEMSDPSFSLTNEIHRFGINCRHLGRLRRRLLNDPKNSNKKQMFKPTFVLVEIAARAAKNHLQAKWRKKMAETKVPSSEPYRDVAVRYFNKVLRDEKGYWSDPHLFKSHIQWSFHHALTPEELEPGFNLRSLFLADGERFWPMFFRRLQTLSRVKLTDRMNKIIEASKGSSRIQLLSIDITNLSTKVKHLDLIDMAEGKMLYLQAQDKTYSLYQKERLFRLASERFKAAIAANTNNPEILFAWGVSLAQESELDRNPRAIVTLKEANKKMELCCRLLDPSEGRNVEDLSPSEVALLTQVYFERAQVLVKLAAHTKVCSHTTATASPDYSTDYDYLKKAREVLSNIRHLMKHTNQKDSSLERMLYDEARKVYDKELMHINLDDHCVEAQLPKSKEGDRFSKESKDPMTSVKQDIYLHAIAKFIYAYYWHELFLSFKYSGTVFVQASEICMRWATLSALHADFLDNSYQTLFLISGQILEAAILRSVYVFPLVRANERTPGIKSCYIERLTTASMAAKVEDRKSLTGRTNSPGPANRLKQTGTFLPSGIGGASSSNLTAAPPAHLSSSFSTVSSNLGQLLYPSAVIMQALISYDDPNGKKKWCLLIQGGGSVSENLLILRDVKNDANYKKVFLKSTTVSIIGKKIKLVASTGKSTNLYFDTEIESKVWFPHLERVAANFNTNDASSRGAESDGLRRESSLRKSYKVESDSDASTSHDGPEDDKKKKGKGKKGKEKAKDSVPAETPKGNTHIYHLQLKASSSTKLSASTFSFPNANGQPTRAPPSSGSSTTTDVKLAVPKIRLLIPTVHRSSGGKLSENLFFTQSALSESSFLFSFAFGSVKISRIEFLLDEKHSVEFRTLAHAKLFIFSETPSFSQWQKIHPAIQSGKVAEVEAVCEKFSAQIFPFEITSAKFQKIEVASKALFCWLHIEPVTREAISIQSCKFYGSLKGLPTFIKHTESANVKPASPPSSHPIATPPRPLLHPPAMHAKKPPPHEGNTALMSSGGLKTSGGGSISVGETLKTRARTSSVSSGVTYCEEDINMTIWTHMFKNYTWLAAVLRITENSYILSNLVAYIVSQKKEEPHYKMTPPPKELKLLDLVPTLIEPLKFSTNEDAIEVPLRKAELKFDSLIMPNCKLVNRHVIQSFTGWGNSVHTVNLNNTK